MAQVTQPQTDARYFELDTARKIRHRNKLYYRFNHWPIWIFVFFIAPGRSRLICSSAGSTSGC